MFIYDVSDTSPYRVFTAAETLEGAFRAGTLDADGLKVATAGTIPIGIYIDGDATGTDINVMISGGGLWTLGETVQAGDLLSAGAGGKAVKATEGEFIFARALEGGNADEAIHILIINAGVKGADG